MRIFIPGGYGLIGGRLALSLASAGHEIILGSRRPQNASPEWLPGASVVAVDWSSLEDLKKNCEDIDVVIHAAGMNSQDCNADPIGALAFNGVTTTRLSKAAEQAGVKQFIYLSTVHVYGENQASDEYSSGSYTEETCPRNKSIYASSHLAGENGVLAITSGGRMKGLVLRLSNTFGAPSHKDVNCWMLLANDLCRQAVVNRRLILNSSGEQFRDFVPLEHVCSVVKEIIRRLPAHTDSNILNVASGSPKTILFMAKLIQARAEKVLGFKPELELGRKENGSKHLPIEYRSIYGSELWDEITEKNFEKEIDELLYFCKSTF